MSGPLTRMASSALCSVNEGETMNGKKEIKGICPLTAIPFDENGEIDYRQFEHLLDCLIASGVHGIGLFGVVGEFSKLDDGEKMELAGRMIRRLKDTPLYSLISITDHSTEIAVKRAKRFEALGADALMLLPPHFLNPPIDQIRYHLLSVVGAVDIPVVIQYAPNETGVSISPEELVSIAQENQNVLYKIECNDPAAYSSQLLKMKNDLSIMNGYWGINLLDLLSIGGKGVMPGFSCCELYLEIYNRFMKGKVNAAAELHSHLASYFKRWNTSVERMISMEKEILCRRGMLSTKYCRHPGYELGSEDYQEVDRFLEEFGIVLSNF